MNLSTIDPVLDSHPASLANFYLYLNLITMGTKVEDLSEISLFLFFIILSFAHTLGINNHS